MIPHCLSVDEILRRVLADTYAYGGYGTLASLAATCRLFRDPALDELWQYQTSMAQIIMCLPEDVCEFIGGDSLCSNGPVGKELNIKRPLHASDWARLQLYAKRVRVLDFQDERKMPWAKLDSMNAAHLLKFLASAPMLPLFPKLQKLVVADAQLSDDCIPYIQTMLLSPSITSCVLKHRMQRGSAVPSLVAAIRDVCPLLEIFKLAANSSWIERAEVPVLSAVVEGWNMIRQLEVVALNSQGISHIATLPRLRTLSLCSVELVDLPPQSTSFVFPALRILRLASSSLETLLTFLRRLPHHIPLETIQMMYTSYLPIPTQWRAAGSSARHS
ncbi:hypothetical protein PLICRDRAFT_539314 [Plicaturopsis crispa FD-325 SS-3]|nr:hypothetical protein PLICRDRAFT_539314 [Plicaturopsis crispa FD-325 SS-3]